MAWLTPGKYAPPPPRMCYRAQFGRFALNGVGINTGEPLKMGSPGTPLPWNGRHG